MIVLTIISTILLGLLMAWLTLIMIQEIKEDIKIVKNKFFYIVFVAPLIIIAISFITHILTM